MVLQFTRWVGSRQAWRMAIVVALLPGVAWADGVDSALGAVFTVIILIAGVGLLAFLGLVYVLNSSSQRAHEEKVRLARQAQWFAQSLEEARPQLEGRLEVVEAARERHARLWERLSHLGWKDDLRVPLDMSRHEPAFDEAVEFIHQRAKAQGWRDDAPVLQLLREVQARRERLRVLVQDRLDALSPGSGGLPLQEALQRLEEAFLERAKSGGTKP